MAELVEHPVVTLNSTNDASENIARLINQANGTRLRGQDIVITNPRQHSDYTDIKASLITVGPVEGGAYIGGTVDFEYLRLDLSRVTHKVEMGDPIRRIHDGSTIVNDINGLTIPTSVEGEGDNAQTIYGHAGDPENPDDSSYFITPTPEEPPEGFQKEEVALYGREVAYLKIENQIVPAGDNGTVETLVEQINSLLALVPGQLDIYVQQQPDIWVEDMNERATLTYNDVNNATDTRIDETIVGVRDNGSGVEVYFKPSSYSEADNEIQTWNKLNALPLSIVEKFSDLQVGVSPVPLLLRARDDSPIYVGQVDMFVEIVFSDLISKSTLNGFAYDDQQHANQQARNEANNSEQGDTVTN